MSRRGFEPVPARWTFPGTLSGAVAILGAVLLPASPAPLPGASPAADDEPEIRTELVERGVYSVRLRGMVAVPARELLGVLLDYESQCSEGCRYTVPGIRRAEILDRRAGEEELRLLTWTFIDDVLDASYFSAILVTGLPPAGEPTPGPKGTADGTAIGEGEAEAGDATEAPTRVTVLRFGTPDAAAIARWSTPERPHDPFFHEVEGSWTLEGLDRARGTATRVELRMRMHSDRFLVNLLPDRVLDGAREHAAAIFGYLRALERAEGESAPGQDPVRPGQEP